MTCPIESCPFEATGLGLCAGHMKLCPVPIKAEIYELVKRHKGGPSHLKAIRRACIAVNSVLERWKQPERVATLPYKD